MLPLVGFLPPSDPRIRGTVERIEKELMQDGLLLRYRPQETHDGFTEEEGTFLACSFWLVDNYALQGEWQKAQTLFENLLQLQNDVGLLSEEYDTMKKRQVGNFPQALSHIALVNSAVNLWTHQQGSAKDRSQRQSHSSKVVSRHKLDTQQAKSLR
jgi:GH15 family glucan-1,4-alpha-glucosidase